MPRPGVKKGEDLGNRWLQRAKVQVLRVGCWVMWLEEEARVGREGLCVPSQGIWFLSQTSWRTAEGFEAQER